MRRSSSNRIVGIKFGFAALVPLLLNFAAAGQSRRFAPDYVPMELAQQFGVRQVGETSAELIGNSQFRSASKAYETILRRADRMVKEGKIDHAILLYADAIKRIPAGAGAYFGLSRAYAQIGKFDEALEVCRKTAALFPRDPKVKLNLGAIFYYRGDIAEAVENYNQALRLEKRLPEARFNLAMAYAHQGDFDRAVEEYRAAAALRGDAYPEAYNNLGLIFEAMDDLEAAAAHFQKAIEQKKGRYPLARYNMARLYAAGKSYDEALSELQLAAAQQPDFPEAYLNIGNLYLLRASSREAADLEKAAAAYRKAIALRRDFYPLAHENLAIALSLSGRREDAISQYRIAFKQYEGGCPETLNNLISTLLKKEIFSIGDELSRSDNPGNLKAGGRAGEIRLRAGKSLKEALDQYNNLNDELKTSTDVRYCAGLAFYAVGDWTKAIDEFSAAVVLSKNKDSEARAALKSVLELALYY